MKAVSSSDIGRHNTEIQRNLDAWQRKPVLRRIYRRFHELIAAELSGIPDGQIVELGSGIGNIKEVIPACLRTDLFPNPWLDQQEDAYNLSFENESCAALILFDVFHHLQYPGTALAEMSRVLVPGGRVVVFEPCVSLLGRLVYGLMHNEPLGLKHPITLEAPSGWSSDEAGYYAAQGNAWRLFVRGEQSSLLSRWHARRCQRYSTISYVASGGYSSPQLYPSFALPAMWALDTVCDLLPMVFATRLQVVLEKITERE
ncbi:MAG: class I SAM-dependent methyltransferase [Kiritimatiellia bacterium]|jgi:SAM-dependent methyltransferase|nr:class I SAM-dependent methyltransferase [Kiritimatiellia bacterium]